jgi:uncharacterized protein YcfL
MKFLASMLASLVLAGCASPESPKPAPAAAEKKPDKRVVLDPALKGSLQEVGVRTETGGDGILKFQVDVQNLTPTVQSVVYQIDWLDRDGISLGIHYDDLHWLLLPHETGPLTMTAPTPLAKDFRLTFHPRRRTSNPTPP